MNQAGWALSISHSLATATLVIAVGVILWDIVLAGWIASRKEAPIIFTQLTTLCGLLVAPALLVALATGTEAGARTISGVAWLLPFVALAFVVQVLYALAARLVSPVVCVPILLYDAAVATIAIGDYLVAQRGSAPIGLQAAVAARDALFGMSIGRAALASPFTLLVPMLAPAYPARWRLSAVVRATLVLAATVVTTLLGLEWPRGIGAIRSYQSALQEPSVPRTAGEFMIGMRLFPTLEGPPPARSTSADLTMARLLQPDAVLIVLDRAATTASALDSLARVLEPLRVARARIAIALNVGAQPSPLDDLDRLSAIERVMVRVRPDVLFPALDGPMPPVLPRRRPSVDWWRTTTSRAALLASRVRPATTIGWAAARLDATDSAVYQWASAKSSRVQLIGAVSYPSFSGLPAVDARLRAFERWHAQAVAAGGGAQPHWLVNVGGLAHAHGDAAQLAAIRHAVAWASQRTWIHAAVIGEPADYEGGVGLRAANGRTRVALGQITMTANAIRGVR